MRVCALVVSMFVAVGACAEVGLEDTPDGLVVRTSQYVARISQNTGFLVSLTTGKGEELITGSRVYCDVLPDGRRAFSPRASVPPAVTRGEKPGPEFVIETTGQLVDNEGRLHPEYPFTYCVRYEFSDASSQLRIRTSVVPGFDADDIHGFLAHVFSLAPYQEFFAQTEEGRVSQLASDHSTRVFQSEQEPLSHLDPRLGVLLKTGSVLSLRVDLENPPLQNVFIHDNGKGGAALFLANLSSNTPLKAEKGQTWVSEATLETMPLDDLFQSQGK